MPVLFLLSGPKMGYSPHRGDMFLDKREIWLGGADLPNFTFIWAQIWEYSPETVKISNLGHKFVPRSQYFFYQIFSVCTRL